MTGGYGAEYGRSTGGVFNVVTKSGGNDFHGDVFAYYRNKNWSPDDVVRRRNKETTDVLQRRHERRLRRVARRPDGASDKLWFFVAADPTRRTTYIGGAVSGGVAAPSAGQKYDTDTNIYAAKLTFSAEREPHPGALRVRRPDDAAAAGSGSRTPSPARRSATRRRRQPQRRAPLQRHPHAVVAGRGDASAATTSATSSSPTATPAATSRGRSTRRSGSTSTAASSGNQVDKSDRDACVLKFTNFLGNHELRYGIDVERNNYDADLHELWYRYFGYSGSRGGVLTSRAATTR